MSGGVIADGVLPPTESRSKHLELMKSGSKLNPRQHSVSLKRSGLCFDPSCSVCANKLLDLTHWDFLRVPPADSVYQRINVCFHGADFCFSLVIKRSHSELQHRAAVRIIFVCSW